MAKRKYKRKTWWQKHWDEVVLWTILAVSTYLILKGSGAI